VQLPLDHHCPWREHALELERRIAELAAIVSRQQQMLEEHVAWRQKLIEEQVASQQWLETQAAQREAQEAEQRARLLELQSQVAKLERDLLGPKSEKIKIPPHDRDREDESEEDQERRRQEALEKRRERALAKDAALASDEVEHPIPDEMKACPTCGGTEHDELPDEVTTRIEYVPGRFVKRRHRRKKIVRKCGCPKTSIVVAPGPPAPIHGGLYGASFIAFLIVEKCADSMPIYRVEKRFARLGIPISRSTMNDLVLAGAERLRPLFARLAVRMKNVAIVLADETSMRLQDRDKRGFVWVFHGHDDASGGQLVLYTFAVDRSGETPKKILGASEGTLVVDGYTGYNVVTDPSQRTRGGCWCHARRKFFEARSTAPQEAEHAIELMRPLFRVEAEATIRGIVGTDDHLALRRERSQPIVDELFEWTIETRPSVLPKSPIGTALGYMQRQRSRLELFLSDARVPLHNNESESRLRLIALLRKNSLFFGHPRAGKLWAGLFSLTVGAVANDHEPTAYLTDVLLRVRHDMTDDEVDALLPDRWTPAT
jgi:transposase